MLYEFAVEPDVFSDFAEYKLWAERFGIASARVISKYPHDWISLAVNAAKQREQAPVKRATIVEGLRRFKERGKILDLERQPYFGNDSWVTNALDQHRRSPFHAVIVKRNASGSAGVLESSNVDESTPAIAVEHGCCVRRRAQEMAAAMMLVLRASKRVTFVDPYFHPSEPRFNRPLRAFLAEAAKGNRLEEVAIHLSGDLRDSAPTADFQRACANSLPQSIPHGTVVTLVRWANLSRGDTLHPRYILTDICGVRFDHGLDEGAENETTDVEILSDSVFRLRRSQYRTGSTAFRMLDSTTVTGTQM